jgi:hypothetical protein
LRCCPTRACRHFIRSDGSDHREPAFAPFHREAHREVVTGVVIWITGNADILRDEGPTLLSAERTQIMTIFPMMRSGSVALVLVAAASLVQGCGSSAPMQVSFRDPGQSTAPYSGTAWYVDLDHVMTTDSGGD